VTRLRAALTALALAVSVLLTGCSQGAPTTAAIVNGVVIHEATIDEITDGILAAAPGSVRSKVRTSVVKAVLTGELARQIADAKNISLKPADAAQLAAGDAGLQAILETTQGARYATFVSDWSQVATSLGDDLPTVLADQSVTLNPRYGSWAEYSTNTSTTPVTGSLSGTAKS
jgi:uncharacterized cupin superfamily protein